METHIKQEASVNCAFAAEAEPYPAGFIHSVLLLRSSHRRSPSTTNLDRILRDLLDDILQGYSTVQEADASYGVKQPGTGGRQRRFATFAAYLDDRIHYATDPAVERQLRGLLARMGASPHCRGADTRLVNRMLDETGRERVDRLRELRAELAPPAV
jgi:hypothetical protein